MVGRQDPLFVRITRAFSQSISTVKRVPGAFDSTVDAFLTASRALVAVSARSLAAAVPIDVTLPQFRALVILASKGPQQIDELADALDIHTSAATRLCDQLVDRKLMRRSTERPNKGDATVALTTSARLVVEDVATLRRSEIRAILQRMPAPMRGTAIDALRAFSDAADEPPEQAWGLGWN